MAQKFSNEQIQMILNSLSSGFDASIANAQSNNPKEIQSLTIDLTDEKTRVQGYKVNFPFTSLYVEDATDLNTELFFVPNLNDGTQDSIRLKKRDSMTFERGTAGGTLYWPAQANKTIVLKFLVTSKFQNGSLIIDNANTPSSFSFGHASSDLDGYTLLVKLGYSDNNGDTFFSFCTSDAQYNGDRTDNNIYISTNPILGTGKVFVVPQGYRCKILSGEVNVKTAPSFARDIYLNTIPNNTDLGSSFGYQDYSVGRSDGFPIVALGKTNMFFNAYEAQAGFQGSGIALNGRSTVYADEGEIITMNVANGSPTGSGVFDLVLLCRLERKVQ